MQVRGLFPSIGDSITLDSIRNQTFQCRKNSMRLISKLVSMMLKNSNFITSFYQLIDINTVQSVLLEGVQISPISHVAGQITFLWSNFIPEPNKYLVQLIRNIMIRLKNEQESLNQNIEYMSEIWDGEVESLVINYKINRVDHCREAIIKLIDSFTITENNFIQITEIFMECIIDIFNQDNIKLIQLYSAYIKPRLVKISTVAINTSIESINIIIELYLRILQVALDKVISPATFVFHKKTTDKSIYTQYARLFSIIIAQLINNIKR